ncbi:hypothetical protein [Modestobacter sp. NPDC049651]|uniref:hypothetical protein n=1 Tax=unclassified Modestobacter TaxID=2643866 RepID=UPI0033D05C3C
MRITSPSRRAAAVLAVSAIGMSTAVLSVTGVASASVDRDFTFSTDASSDADVLLVDGEHELTIDDRYCSITWDLTGGSGGADTNENEGSLADHLVVETDLDIAPDDTVSYWLYPGTKGGDALAGDPASPGAGGRNWAGGNGLDGWYDGDLYAGGGGGAASAVRTSEFLPPAQQGLAGGAIGGEYLSADGGAGAGADEGYGLGGGHGFVHPQGATPTVAVNAPTMGDGVISGTAHLCAPQDNGGGVVVTDPVDENDGGQQEQPPAVTVTGAPNVKWVDGGDHSLSFQLWRTTVADGEKITGVQYSLNGGSWTAVTDVENTGDFQYEGTIGGLVTGKSYSVSFRFTTNNKPTEASEPVSAAPVAPAPTAVTAVAGPSSIKVGWKPSAEPQGVTGYVAWAIPTKAQSGDEPPMCATDAATFSCVLGVPAGQVYDVYVVATTGDEWGVSSEPVTTATVAPVAVSQTLPKASGVLTSDAKDGKAVAGGKVVISGKDFLPGSTVELVIYSTPVSLGSAVVGPDGTFSQEVTLPKELANGTHHLVASGVDVNGDPRNLVVEVAVTGGTAAAATGNGTGLAYTGATVLPYLGGGLVALLAGGALVLFGRRRNA